MRVFPGLWLCCIVGDLTRFPNVRGDDELLVSAINNQDTQTKQEGSGTLTHAPVDVLVVLEGPADNTTKWVFRDIADIVHDGLTDLGHPSKIIYCTNIVFDDCFGRGTQLIILAPHNLASWYTLDGKSAVLELNILPPDAVLYNFEQVPRDWPQLEPGSSSAAQHAERDQSLISKHTLEIYSKFKVWDYSSENVKSLDGIGIRAELVPLGFSPKLRSSAVYPEHEEDIDVLFIGMETPRRRETIRRLRNAGVKVVHPNSEGMDLFGADFDTISARSKIVLNLNAFWGVPSEETAPCSSSSSSSSDDDDPNALCNTGEWKMPRLARLLANGRFIVSETSGSPAERASLSGGLVFVTPEQLAETCMFYLNRPDLRVAIAEQGRQLFERRLEADVLRSSVKAMLERRERP